MVVLALDVGEKRIGVARSDALGLLASPLTTVIRTSDKEAVTAIGQLARESGAEIVVVGLPLAAGGERSEQARRVAAFARKLRGIEHVRLVFWDERFSTATAGDYLAATQTRRRGAPSPRRREAARRRLDAAAAAVILQDFLDQQRAGDSTADLCESF